MNSKPATCSLGSLLVYGLAATLMGSLVTSALAGTAPSSLSSKQPVAPPASVVDWKEHTCPPVANFVFFEDPVIRTEFRPIFVFHRIPNDFVTGGGEVLMGGAQLRYAVNDRLGLFLNQGGYLEVHPEYGEDFGGWADLGFGVKYAVIDDAASQFVLTPGVGFTVPTGDADIYHGRGNGEWNIFVSALKGFGDFHVTGNIGLRLPNDMDEQSTSLHYSLQADYYVCRYFVPFAVANAWTVLDAGKNLPLNAEGYDAFNFGSANADGVTQMTIGGGFRSRLTDHVDFGVAYEKAVLSPEGFFDDRFTFDISIRF